MRVKNGLRNARWLAGFGLLLAYACSAPTDAPEFTVRSPVNLSQLVGLKDLKGKVAVLDFWATWCGPCRQAIPTVESTYRKFRGKGVDVMGISMENPQVVNSFQKEMHVDYPLYVDDGTANRAFKITTIPRLFVLNKDGDIVYDHNGYPIDEQELDAVIEKSLSESPTPQ